MISGHLSIFCAQALDESDEWEACLKGPLQQVHAILTSTSDLSESTSMLQGQANEGSSHAEITTGLLLAILVSDPGSNQASNWFQMLNMIQRDNFACCVKELTHICIEKYPRLSDASRQNLVWLLREMVGLHVADIDAVLLALMRQMTGGDCRERNISVVSGVVSIFSEHRGQDWLLKSSPSHLASVVFYTFTRLAFDHVPGGSHDALRRKEARVCVSLWRGRCADCCSGGRDIVRLLKGVSSQFEPGQTETCGFATIWSDLVAWSTVAAGQQTLATPPPQQAGIISDYKDAAGHSRPTIQKLLSIRTSKRFLLSRVTPVMESRLVFMLQHVKQGAAGTDESSRGTAGKRASTTPTNENSNLSIPLRRYQEWFARDHLSAGPESESLVGDLVRFICAVFHPPDR